MKPIKQDTQNRLSRLNKGRCPLHNKPMLQCDTWYQPRNGRRYTYVGCVDLRCRVEAIADCTFSMFKLLPEWRYLLEQNTSGTSDILTFPSNYKLANTHNPNA